MIFSLLHIMFYLTLLSPLHTLTDAQDPNAPSNSPVRWDLIATGICGTVLLLAVVALVGIATYAYRHKQKQRQRRCVLSNSLCELTDRPQNGMIVYIVSRMPL